VLVNTCSVTAEADRQARQAMRRARREKPGARGVAAGGYARRPGVGLVAGGVGGPGGSGPSAEGPAAACRVDGGAGGTRQRDDREATSVARGEAVLGSKAGAAALPQRITRFDGHARAFVKVQDGCDRRCSFCVIPLIRGDSSSRPLSELVEEVRGLAA